MELRFAVLMLCALGVVIVIANGITTLLGLWLSQQKWYIRWASKVGRRITEETINLWDEKEKEP